MVVLFFFVWCSPLLSWTIQASAGTQEAVPARLINISHLLLVGCHVVFNKSLTLIGVSDVVESGGF